MATRENKSYVSEWTEEGLRKIKDELNPFTYGSNFDISVGARKFETYGDMMRRWHETVADSKLTNQYFTILTEDYKNTLKKGEDKYALIEELIKVSEYHAIHEPARNFREGFLNKGYRWYKIKRNFSLKDFVVHHPGTISHELDTVDTSGIVVTEAFIENAPTREEYFCYACEGWAHAKFVAFLKDEQAGEKLPSRKIKHDEFIPKKFSEVFTDNALIESCLDLLRETDKPCIDNKNGFIRRKGVFVIWFNALETKKLLNYFFANDDERAATLNNNFPGLSISSSMFRSKNIRATRDYKKYFETQISSLKTPTTLTRVT